MVYSSPSLQLGTVRNLLFSAWVDTPTVADMRAVEHTSHGLARPHPKGNAMLSLVLRGTPRFGDDVRAAFVRVNSDPTCFPLGSARVLLVPGFAAVAVRAFLNTVTLVSRRVRPVQAFTSVREAAAWLAPKLAGGGVPWTAEEIEALCAPYEAQARAGA